MGDPWIWFAVVASVVPQLSDVEWISPLHRFRDIAHLLIITLRNTIHAVMSTPDPVSSMRRVIPY